MTMLDGEPWYCPNCGEPCDHESGIHPACHEPFRRSVENDRIEGDAPNLTDPFSDA